MPPSSYTVAITMHSHGDTTNHISGLDLLAGLKATLADKRVGIDYEEVVAEFGQVPASEERLRGKKFHIRDHVRGLVLAQLSSQRPGGPIAGNMAKIDRLFHKWDPDKLLEISATELVDGVRGIHCGNRLIAKQMNSLVPNIKTLRRIEVELQCRKFESTTSRRHALRRNLGRATLSSNQTF